MALMVGIMLTGNYRWFPLNALAIAMLLVDDRTWWRLLRRFRVSPREATPVSPTVRRGARVRLAAAVVTTGFLFLIGACETLDSCLPDGRQPRLLWATRTWLRPYHVSHRFQLFGQVRKTHRVIVFEGSDDGVAWSEFDNHLAPGALDRPCRFVAPYHYHLDFLMWLSGDVEWSISPGWLKQLVFGLLSGNAPTYRLFRCSTFAPERPPKFVRGRRYVYRYADSTTRAQGQWWIREPDGMWCPTATLRDGVLAVVQDPQPAVAPPRRRDDR
jgi:hypothetical protein